MSAISTYAIVENGVVTNTVLWDGNTENWQPPPESTANLLPEGSPVCQGYMFDGNNYTAPQVASETIT
jgi:hypothetical protein